MDLNDTELQIMRDAVKYLKRNKEQPKGDDGNAWAAYWEKAAQEMNGFGEYYKFHSLAVRMAMACYEYLEDLAKEGRK